MVKVSVILPTLNEEQGIGTTIDTINKKIFSEKGWDLEIVIVDGNSKDKTRQIAKKKGAQVILEKRKGYGRAYKTGLSKLTGDIIVTGDADATYPFDHIPEYIQLLLNEDLDFITTDRFAQLHHGSMSVTHYFGNFVLAWTLKFLFLMNLRDSQSGMWIFRKDILKKIQPLENFNNGMPFSEEIKIEMFREKTIKTKEIPSLLRARQGQVKIQSFSDGIKNFRFLFVKRVNFFK